MKQARRRWPWWAVAVSIVWASGAAATMDVDLSLEQLARASAFVVRGEVLGVESREEGEGGSIVTLVRIRVAEALKGTGSGEPVIELEGGRVGDRAMFVAGSPDFATGDEVVLFLTRGPAGRYHVVEMAQGTYAIERDAEGKAWVAAGRLPLESFMSDLRRVTRAQGGGQWLH